MCHNNDKEMCHMAKRYKRKTARSGLETVVNLLALLLFAVLGIGFVAALFFTHMLTPLLLAVIAAAVVVAVVVVFALRFSRGPAKRTAGSVLSVVFCLVFAVGIVYARVGLDTLDRVTNPEAQTLAMSVYVRGDDPRSMDELLQHPFGMLSADQTDTQAAVKQLDAKYSVTLTPQGYPEATKLVDALNNKEIDAILVNQSHMTVLDDLEEYKDVMQSLRMVDTIQVPLQASAAPQPTTAPAIPLDQPFTVYISGSDSRSSDISTSGNSDVNIIATINPKTHQVLLVSTPRDYFIPLSFSGGVPDKLTHAGGRGIEESIKTLEMLYDIELDYYFKVNFAGFEGIIDALGGIDVYSDYDFESYISDYTYEKGVNHMDGEKALYFVRERYNLPKGDYQRGIHQMRMIEAVADKVLSPAILTQYLPFMDAVGNCFRTSIPSDFITDMVQNQLQTGGDWNIVSYYVSGSFSKEYTYSYPDWHLDVIVPDMTTVETAKQLMEQVRNGEIVTSPQS